MIRGLIAVGLGSWTVRELQLSACQDRGSLALIGLNWH